MGGFLAELRRRHMFRIGGIYVVVAWGITQVIDVLSQIYALPDWIAQPIVAVLAIGFPVILIAAWVIVGAAKSADTPAERLKATATDWVLVSVLTAVLAFLGYQQLSLSTENTSIAGLEDEVTDPALATNNSIAVLPFGNLSPDPENEFFADGIHQQVVTQLSKIGALKVTSSTSVREYRDTPMNIREIGVELGVRNILEGNVQRAGTSVQINVTLINAEADETIWAESYDRDLSAQNMFAIQREMATAIASALNATLAPQEFARLSEIPTQNSLAYDYFLRGEEIGFSDLRGGVGSTLQADMYERAVMEDPGFALAWTALSRAHSGIYLLGFDRTESRLSQSLEAAQTALELDPDLPEAHLALGLYHYRGSLDYARALSELAIAEQGLPGSTEVLVQRAFIQRRLGEWEESIASLAQVIELDPRNADRFNQQGETYLDLRDYTQADDHFRRALELEPGHVLAFIRQSQIPLFRDGEVETVWTAVETAPFDLGDWEMYLSWLAALYERDFDLALEALNAWNRDEFEENRTYLLKSSLTAIVYQLAGRSDEASRAFQAARLELEEPLANNVDDPRVYLALGEVLAGLGEYQDAITAGRRAMEIRPITTDAFDGPNFQLDAVMRIFIPAGDHELAIEELDRYLGGSGGEWSIEGLLPDPRLDPIREDPRFVALVEKYRRQ